MHNGGGDVDALVQDELNVFGEEKVMDVLQYHSLFGCI